MTRRRLFLGMASAGLVRKARAESTSVLLGYSGDAKLLMVHADDVGMCHSANVATVEALKHGMLVSGSIMMPCPWVPEIAAYCRENPQADLGLHLTLTSEWKGMRWRPLSPPEKVPGLLDEGGYLFRDVGSVARRSNPKEVEHELRAQVALARRLGIGFTHLDTHMGTLYARPDFFEVYTALARELNVPCMLPRVTPELKAAMSEYPITEEMLEAKRKGGWPVLDRLVTGVPGRTVAERYESYNRFLQDLKPGVTKLIVHLAMDDAEIRSITNAWEQRYADYKYFTDPATRTLMSRLGIRTITYRELGRIAYK